MFIALWALNNITIHKILHTCCGILSDNFWHQTTNNFDKLFKEDDNKNTTKITIPILLVIKIYIGPTRLLEDCTITANNNLEGRLYGESQSLDWGDDREIEEAITDAKDNKDKAKDS